MTKAILLDIEGTTTPIDFVHKTLFPFARRRIGKYVEQHFNDLANEIAKLVDEAAGDGTYTVPVDPSEPGSVSAYLEHLIDVDRKSTPLKSIQGNIWKEGYESGDLKSIVYDDVRPAFERWTSEGRTIAIYSSGSILAQQLLFRHTDHGDLTPFISHHFDTNIGHKRDADSYRSIVRSLGTDASDISFFSDIPQEVAAASEAGMQAALVVRPGNPEHDPAGFPTIRSFDELT